MNRLMINFLCGSILAMTMAACTTAPLPNAPQPATNDPIGSRNPSLRIAVLDAHVLGDLSEPAVMAKYARADLLVTDPGRFWGSPAREHDLELLRAANPNMKILAFFRSKCVRMEWSTPPAAGTSFEYELYQAARPWFSYTTQGDTLQDWPGVAIFDYTKPGARQAMLDVFEAWQTTTPAKLDGVYWDYFSRELWISPDVTSMTGEPDMDGDGVVHLSDTDELAAFRDAQEDWILEMRSRMGAGFLQVANGARALSDSTFAGLLDGMNYEIFPYIGFPGGQPYKSALDPAVYNNLWAARGWLRTQNGGPWLLLDNVWIPYVADQHGVMRPVDLGNVNRAIAMLTDAAPVHFDLTGAHHAGIPEVEINLGEPLGGVIIEGDSFQRLFDYGSVTVTMGTGAYPLGLSYVIKRHLPGGGEAVIEELRTGYMYP